MCVVTLANTIYIYKQSSNRQIVYLVIGSKERIEDTFVSRVVIVSRPETRYICNQSCMYYVCFFFGRIQDTYTTRAE